MLGRLVALLLLFTVQHGYYGNDARNDHGPEALGPMRSRLGTGVKGRAGRHCCAMGPSYHHGDRLSSIINEYIGAKLSLAARHMARSAHAFGPPPMRFSTPLNCK